MIKLTTLKEYRQQTNPWRNSFCNVIHYLPFIFPKFRSKFWTEIIYLIAGIPVVLTLYLIFDWIFNFTGLHMPTAHAEVLVRPIHFDIEILTLATIFVVGGRLMTFVSSKLNKPAITYFFGFAVGFAIPITIDFVFGLPQELRYAWAARPDFMRTILILLFFGYLVSTGLERQHEQAMLSNSP